MIDAPTDAAPNQAAPEQAPPTEADAAKASAWAEFEHTEKVDKSDDHAARDTAAWEKETATPTRPQPSPSDAGARDIWAAATPEQRAAYSAAKEKADYHERMRRTVSGLNRKIDELSQANR